MRVACGSTSWQVAERAGRTSRCVRQFLGLSTSPPSRLGSGGNVPTRQRANLPARLSRLSLAATRVGQLARCRVSGHKCFARELLSVPVSPHLSAKLPGSSLWRGGGKCSRSPTKSSCLQCGSVAAARVYARFTHVLPARVGDTISRRCCWGFFDPKGERGALRRRDTGQRNRVYEGRCDSAHSGHLLSPHLVGGQYGVGDRCRRRTGERRRATYGHPATRADD